MKRKLYIIIVIVLVIITAGWYGYKALWGNQDMVPPNAGGKDAAKVEFVAASINGSNTSEENAARRPVAVMIDNSISSRPQSGLSKAEIVYETVAEGGITRYLALFQAGDVATIGPVRSARPYYALLASDWQALFAHVGGSNEALAEIANGSFPGLIDINQFYQDSYFERTTTRVAPFNVYTSTHKLYTFLGTQGKSTAQRRTLFSFKTELSPLAEGQGQPAVLVPAYSVSINFSLPAFTVDYTYDALKNTYKRSLAGKPHVDALTNTQVEAKTIIIQYADIVPIPKDKLARVNVNLVGTGNALIFMDGKSVEAKWKKTKYGRTIFMDYDNKELAINPGPIWVEIVPGGKEKVVTFEGALLNPDGTVKKEGSLN